MIFWKFSWLQVFVAFEPPPCRFTIMGCCCLLCAHFRGEGGRVVGDPSHFLQRRCGKSSYDSYVLANWRWWPRIRGDSEEFLFCPLWLLCFTFKEVVEQGALATLSPDESGPRCTVINGKRYLLLSDDLLAQGQETTASQVKKNRSSDGDGAVWHFHRVKLDPGECCVNLWVVLVAGGGLPPQRFCPALR